MQTIPTAPRPARRRSPFALLQALVCALVLLSGLSAAHADPILEVGFESPDFTVGPVNGQSGWSGQSSVTVQSTTVLAGSQALQIDVPPGGGGVGTRPALSYDPAFGQSPVVRVRAYFRFGSLPTTQFSCFSFFGESGFFGQVVAGEPFRLGSGRGTIDMSSFIEVGEWQLIEAEVDFRSQRISVWVDGVAAANGAFEQPMTRLSSIDTFAFRGQSQYTVHVDQYAVHAQPPAVHLDGFESGRYSQGPLDGQQGWSGSTAFAVQQAVKSTGDQAISLGVTSTSPFVGMARVLSFNPDTAPSPVIRAGIDFRATAAQTSQVTILSLRTRDGVLQEISAEGGDLILGGPVNAFLFDSSFVADRWYRVELVVDFRSKRVDAYIDGEYKLSREFVGEDLGSINIGAFGGATFTAYWDNLSITSEPARLLDTNFEVPPFTTGSIDLQQGWFGTGATIDANAARTSGHGVRVVATTSSFANATTDIRVDPVIASSDAIEVRGSFRAVSPLGGDALFLSLFDSSQRNFCQLLTDRFGGLFVLSDDGYTPAGEIALDQWYDVAVHLDFVAKRMRFFVDGRLIDERPMDPLVSDLDRIDCFALQSSSTTEFHLDDVSVRPIDFPPAPVITTTLLPNWTEGVPYGGPGGVLLLGTGAGPLTWQNTADVLPTGVALGSDGVLGGTATESGSFGFQAKATDVYGQSARAILFLDIFAPPQFLSDALPAGAVGRDFSASPFASGGTPPVVFDVVGDPLPDGLVLDTANGRVSGRPTAGFVGPLELRITDAVGVEATTSLNFRVASPFEYRRGRARERISLDEGEPRSGSRFLEIVAGSQLDVDLSGRFGDALPELRLIGPDGEDVDPGDAISTSSRRIRIRRLDIGETGRYFLSWTVPLEVERSVRLKVRLKAPRKYQGIVTVDAEGTPVLVPFDAVPGTKLSSIRVKAVKGESVRPRIVSVTDESEIDLVPQGNLKSKRTARFKLKTPLGGSRFVLSLASDNGEAGQLEYKIKLRAPREYDFDLADQPAGDALE